jgi:hypothetical protein
MEKVVMQESRRYLHKYQDVAVPHRRNICKTVNKLRQLVINVQKNIIGRLSAH